MNSISDRHTSSNVPKPPGSPMKPTTLFAISTFLSCIDWTTICVRHTLNTQSSQSLGRAFDKDHSPSRPFHPFRMKMHHLNQPTLSGLKPTQKKKKKKTHHFPALLIQHNMNSSRLRLALIPLTTRFDHSRRNNTQNLPSLLQHRSRNDAHDPFRPASVDEWTVRGSQCVAEGCVRKECYIRYCVSHPYEIRIMVGCGG